MKFPLFAIENDDRMKKISQGKNIANIKHKQVNSSDDS